MMLLDYVDLLTIGTTISLYHNITYPPILHSYVQAGRWDDAVRLCRFVKVGTTISGDGMMRTPLYYTAMYRLGDGMMLLDYVDLLR